MRILIDECLNWRLGRALTGHYAVSVLVRIAVVVLEAPGIQLHHTLPLVPKVLALLSSLRLGQVVRLGP